MRMLKLDAKERDAKVSAAKVRKEGLLPVVVYGAKEETLSLSVDSREFVKLWREAGETAVVDMTTPSGAKNVLIHKVQLDPVSNEPIHVDFYAVMKGQKVQVAVPLEFVGVSPAIKELGGSLVKVVHEITVEAEPANMPSSIEVDISSLVDFESHITIADIKLVAGAVAMAEATETVALVAEAKEEEEFAVEAEGIDSIEVEKKGKAEEEGEEEAAK